jgi:hypothetical protein
MILIGGGDNTPNIHYIKRDHATHFPDHGARLPKLYSSKPLGQTRKSIPSSRSKTALVGEAEAKIINVLSFLLEFGC